jgi:hypothetical protein
MSLNFERGNPQMPKGHALVYYQSTEAADQILITYVVVLPVSVDVTKYMPPFLAPQMGAMTPRELSCFAFPPVPELIERNLSPSELAENRDDDLIFGGKVHPSDVTGLLSKVNDIVQTYAEAYTANLGAINADVSEEVTPNLGISEVLYAFMDPQEKLSELTRMIGKLRFVVEADDQGLIEEVCDDIRALGRYLPVEYRADRILEVAGQTTEVGRRLAQLYVERCYKLAREEYLELKALDQEIEALESTEE